MATTKRVFILILTTLLLTLGIHHKTRAQDDGRVPDTFAQSLSAGCYITAANQCRIHVEPFTIPVNQSTGERVAEFIISANNVSGGSSYTLYHHHTAGSYSYKPVGSWSPTLVTEDFYGVCGQTYYLNILTRGDTSTTTGTFGNAGATGNFTCPTSPTAPTAVQQSFFGLDENNNLVVTWQMLLLMLPLALFSLWYTRHHRN